MRHGRMLLAGLGWGGALGGLALCVLIFLSAYLAFDDHGPAVKPRGDDILRLPAVPEEDVPRVPLARPEGRGSGGGDEGGGGGEGGAPGSGTRPPPSTTPDGTPHAPAGGEPGPAETPPPAAATATPAAPGAGSEPTLGDTARRVAGAVGTEVGQVSPPAGQASEDTGDSLDDAVDALIPQRRHR